MNKPRWEKLHDWWVEDFTFWVDQKDFYLELLHKHPGDKRFLQQVREIDDVIKFEQRRYKKLYGTRFNLRRCKDA